MFGVGLQEVLLLTDSIVESGESTDIFWSSHQLAPLNVQNDCQRLICQTELLFWSEHKGIPMASKSGIAPTVSEMTWLFGGREDLKSHGRLGLLAGAHLPRRHGAAQSHGGPVGVEGGDRSGQPVGC